MSNSKHPLSNVLGKKIKASYVFIQRLVQDRRALIGSLILLCTFVAAILAPEIAPYDPSMSSGPRLAPPSIKYPLGTDNFGRDVFSRVIYGSRISLYVGSISVSIAFLLGVPLGMIAGYYKGYLDEGIMRLIDAMLTFPPLLIALIIMASLGSNLRNVLIALGFVYTPFFARVTRSATLSIVNEDYISAAHIRGETNFYILFKEVLPNIIAPLVVQISLTFAFAILAESALSFLGMGTQPPTPSWGLMIQEGKLYLQEAPWLIFGPGSAIAVVVFASNILGDALRDILDAKEGIR